MNNREVALLVWGLLILIALIAYKPTRTSLVDVFKAFFVRKILTPFIGMIVYISLVVYGLQQVDLWHVGLTKDTVFWFVGTAIVLFINIQDFTKGKNSFKKTLLESFAIVALIKFISNLFPYDFWIEFLLIPFLFFVIGIWYVSKTNDEYYPVEKLFDFIVPAIGLFIACSAIYSTYINFQLFTSHKTVESFLLPIGLTVAYIPYLYVLGLYLVYEFLFVRIGIFLKRDKALAHFTKYQIFMLCKFNLAKIIKFDKENSKYLQRLSSKEDVMNLIQKFEWRDAIKWRFIGRWVFRLLALILTICIAITTVIVLGYSFAWTGFGDYQTPTGEFIRGKTLWNWMELIFIPVVLLFATAYYSNVQRRTELERIESNEQATILQNYLDRMQDLVLEHKLLDVETDQSVAVIATILTRNTLSRLRPEHKASVLRFLDGAGLINVPQSGDVKISMSGMDLKGVGTPLGYTQGYLVGCDFRGADLTESEFVSTQFEYSDFMGAVLEKSNLMDCKFDGTSFEGAFLKGANLFASEFTERTTLPNGERWTPETDWAVFDVVFKDPYSAREYRQMFQEVGVNPDNIDSD